MPYDVSISPEMEHLLQSLLQELDIQPVSQVSTVGVHVGKGSWGIFSFEKGGGV
jgi:fatty acid-binding protein DegV